jgi:murein DD-endopeptidase MepM/ murein hydrolase activator NlpD
MRESDHRTLTALGARSANTLYWQGAFLRLPNSAPRAGFADQRDYIYQNANVDRQVHLGVDLASLAHSPVPAANAGKVVLAEDVGIYGRTVAIDHGFGLVSLYSHLSHIEVQVGQEVAKGEILGKTGTTGMAAGDHLHYSMLVHDTFVNPIEWWDEHWINDNVSSKVAAAGSDKPTSIAVPPLVEGTAAAASSSGAPPRRKKGARRP